MVLREPKSSRQILTCGLQEDLLAVDLKGGAVGGLEVQIWRKVLSGREVSLSVMPGVVMVRTKAGVTSSNSR